MRNIFFALLFIVAIAPVFAWAHGDEASMERISGGYFFDIGYSDEFIAGNVIRFDLSVADKSTGKALPFSSAWVRIREGKTLFFAGPIAYGEFGKPGFSYVFPHAGDYTLSVKFDAPSAAIPEQDFPIKVQGSSEGPAHDGRVLGGITLVIGIGIGVATALAIKKYA